MDVHDGLGSGGAHGSGEPPGSEEANSSTTAGRSDHDGSGDDSAGYEDPARGGAPTAPDGAPASGTMTVQLGGEVRELPAQRDYTGDGRPDAATETSDGRVIVFADTEDNETGAPGPDGKADEAYVVDKQTGRVVGVAHVDPGTGRWVEGADTDSTPSAASPDSAGGNSAGGNSAGGNEVDN